MTPQTGCTLATSAGAMPSAWCVYEHHHNGVLIYINACKLVDVFTLSQARMNTAWLRLVSDDSLLTVRVIYTGTKQDCMREATRYTRSLNPMPHCNMHGYNQQGAARGIVCSNGKSYETQTDACRELDINQGQLSKHLSTGIPRHVKGYTFAYRVQQ